MKRLHVVVLSCALLGTIEFASAQVKHKVGAPNNANNPQPGQPVSPGNNPRTYFVEEGDVVMLEKGDPNHPENWDKSDGTAIGLSGLARFTDRYSLLSDRRTDLL
jgi:hypothetical protein